MMNKLRITKTAASRYCRDGSKKVVATNMCTSSSIDQQHYYTPSPTTTGADNKELFFSSQNSTKNRTNSNVCLDTNTNINSISSKKSNHEAKRKQHQPYYHPNCQLLFHDEMLLNKVLIQRRQYNSQTQARTKKADPTSSVPSKSNKHTKTNQNSNQNKNSQIMLIRLSKRMSELNLCSRREADKLIAKSRVLVNGVAVDTLGSKVSHLETNIRIIHEDDFEHGHDYTVIDDESSCSSRNSSREEQNIRLFDWDRIRGDTVVLHKPKAYVSGQPDPKHGHVPAVQLLTRQNIYFPGIDDSTDNGTATSTDLDYLDVDELKYTLSSGKYLHFARKNKIRRWQKGDKFNHSTDTGTSTSSDHTDDDYNSNNNDDGDDGSRDQNGMTSKEDNDKDNDKNLNPSTLMNYAPAGRLDLDSTGVLIFTKNGTIAKHILSPKTEKEYVVHVEPVHNITREERQKGIQCLPYPPVWDLSVLKNGGKRLWNDRRPMRPLVCAEWIKEGKGKNGKWDGTGMIRLVLQEGKKRQIRRMCRELLGLNVKQLVRTRVGSVKLDNLPEGRWRTLTEKEVRALLE